MKLLTNRSFIAVTILLVVIKSMIGFLQLSYNSDDTVNYAASHFKKDFSAQYSGDEGEVVRSALYFRETGKIMTDSPFHSFAKPRLRPAGIYLTAFRPKAFIYIHRTFINLYEKCSGEKVTVLHFNHYLHWYAVWFAIIKTILFAISVVSFYKLLQLLLLSANLARIGTWLYILIPSVFIYIGWLDCWENPTLSVLIIYFRYFLYDFSGGPGSAGRARIPVVLLAVATVLLRPHLLLVYLGLSACALIFRLRKNAGGIHGSPLIPLTTILLIIAVHIPVLVQNKNYFGVATLSTQSQFEFFQGHNPFARSSWNPNLYLQNKSYFDSVIATQHFGPEVSEYEEARFYGNWAKDWSVHHPKEEIMLTVKKVGGYFLPYNFLNHRFNLYTLILGISFFWFSITVLFQIVRRNFNTIQRDILLLVPPLMTIALTVQFFVGERWRYYAEPFFLLMLLSLVDRYLQKRKAANSVSM